MPGQSSQRWIVVLVVGWFLGFATPAKPHDLTLTESLLVLKTDGSFQVDVVCDLDALALGVPSSTDSALLVAELQSLGDAARQAAEQRLRRTFERRVRVFFDGERVDFGVAFPHHGTALASEAEIPSVYGLVARLEGRIPEGASVVSFRASRAFPPVHLTVMSQGSLVGQRELIEQGGESREFPTLPAVDGASDPGLEGPLVAGQYGALGFWHILPEGLDHILFVLGLFLLSPKLRPLLIQVTAFTIAHAVTLTLATLGLVRLPASVVEPLIALSIVWVAVENIVSDELKPWRPVVVFLFGLLHGLGFAGVLGELGLPEEAMLTALLSFNVGIELGQLTVLAAAWLAFGWAQKRPWYRQRVVIPLSLGIAALGGLWAVERLIA